MTPDEYCTNRINGSNQHYSLLFAAPAQRRAASAIYAFVREVSEIVEEHHDPDVSHPKIEWWWQELQRLHEGTPRHPVTRALLPVIANYRLEREHFLGILTEIAKTSARVRYPTFDFLKEHCQRTGSIPALLVATVFGITDPATHSCIETIGSALRMTDIICALGRDVRNDHLYLPHEDLLRFGVTETDVLARRHSETFAQLIEFEIQRVLEYYQDALARLPHAERARQRPAIILTNLARAQLEEIRRDGYRVLDHRIALTPLRKLWIAWTTYFRQ